MEVGRLRSTSSPCKEEVLEKACLHSSQIKGRNHLQEDRAKRNLISLTFPAVLRINFEIRKIGLKTYIAVQKEAPVYIDLSMDILMFDDFATLMRFMKKRQPGGEQRHD